MNYCDSGYCSQFPCLFYFQRNIYAQDRILGLLAFANINISRKGYKFQYVLCILIQVELMNLYSLRTYNLMLMSIMSNVQNFFSQTYVAGGQYFQCTLRFGYTFSQCVT